MSGLRDILLLVIMIGLVPVSMARPWIGVLGWSWIAYMVPHGLTWGFGRTLPVAMLIGGATLVGLLFAKDRRPIPRTPAVVFLVLFVIHFTLTALLGYYPGLSFGKWDWVTKSILFAFVTMSLFQNRERLRWLYMVMALGLGFYGLKGGLWVLRTGGGERVYGPDMSFFSDNNTLGLALCMVLPLMLYLSREEKRPWLKWLLRATFSFSIIAIIFTYSRGAFVGLTVMLAVLIWRSPWRLRFATAIVIVAFIAAPLLPQRLWDRIGSISGQESAETRDTSVEGRLQAWTTALHIATARPFTGGGFRALWNEDIWQRYHPGDYLKARDAHSVYFEVLGEHGFVGLGLYLAIMLSTLATLRRVRKRWRGHPKHGYLSRYAEMTQLSLYSFIVAGAFLGVAYFDLYFHLVATSAVLQVLSAQALRETAPVPVAAVARSRVPAVPVRAPRRTVPVRRAVPVRRMRSPHA